MHWMCFKLRHGMYISIYCSSNSTNIRRCTSVLLCSQYFFFFRLEQNDPRELRWRDSNPVSAFSQLLADTAGIKQHTTWTNRWGFHMANASNLQRSVSSISPGPQGTAAYGEPPTEFSPPDFMNGSERPLLKLVQCWEQWGNNGTTMVFI